MQRSDIISTIIEGLVENGHLEKEADAVIVTNGFDSKNDKGIVRILDTKSNRMFSFQYLMPYFPKEPILIIENYAEELEKDEVISRANIEGFFTTIENSVRQAGNTIVLSKLIGVDDELTNSDIQHGNFSGYIDEYYRYGAQVGPFKINAYNLETKAELFNDDDFWIRIYENIPDANTICDVTSIQGVHLSPKIAWTNEVIEKFSQFYKNEIPTAEFVVPSDDDENVNIMYVLSRKD